MAPVLHHWAVSITPTVRYEDGTEDAILMQRDLGKTCRDCGGFCDQYERRRDVDGQDKLGYWCNDCGAYWGN